MVVIYRKIEILLFVIIKIISSMDEVIEKSKMWGWDITKAYFVMILEQDEDEDLDQLYTYLENYLSKLAKGIITCLRNESIPNCLFGFNSKIFFIKPTFLSQTFINFRLRFCFKRRSNNLLP